MDEFLMRPVRAAAGGAEKYLPESMREFVWYDDIITLRAVRIKIIFGPAETAYGNEKRFTFCISSPPAKSFKRRHCTRTSVCRATRAQGVAGARITSRPVVIPSRENYAI